MLCQKCGKNQATVYYKQNINGEVSEIALCAECAAKSGIAGKLNNFFADPFTLGFNFLGGQSEGRTRRVSPPTQKVCTLCGSSLRDIIEDGKIPCAKCYEVFRDELADSIERIHGRVTHKGRCPRSHIASAGGEVKASASPDKLTTLKARLSDAIKNEDYENAAKLRDEIRSIENKNSGDTAKGEN